TRPEADYTFPDEIYAGDDVHLTNTSTHPDDLEMTAEWEILNPNWSIDSTGTEWDHDIFDTMIGDYIGELTVTDEIGATDSVKKTIPVLDPRPKPVLKVTGWPKENRKVIIDGTETTTPDRYPL